jgi:hypothetical protein
MKRTIVVAISASMAWACSASGGDGADTNGGAGNEMNATKPSPTKSAVDTKCFVDYSHAAGRCNTSAGDDDAAFDKCLAPVKADLAACCKNGGSASCAGDATKSADVDTKCFVAYSHAAGRCNTSAGDDDAAFDKCLTPVKADLAACCKNGGSSSCAGDATKSAEVDTKCFVDYSHGAGRCNTSAGDDDAAFDKCLTSVKADLAACCKDGGSSSCGAKDS